MRLIDVDALVRELEYEVKQSETILDGMNITKLQRDVVRVDRAHKIAVIHYLKDAPTVDAVPVIRCKECKWYKTNYSWNGKEYRICVIEAYEPVRKADDFCSRAERREE